MISRRALVTALVGSLSASIPAGAAKPGPTVSQASVGPAAPGSDLALSMTIANPGAPDSLVRARCPIANFVEQRMVDLGEGAPSMRVVNAIPVPAGTTRLSGDGPHVMLLQTTQALKPGDVFDCALTFRDGGRQDIEVTVAAPDDR